MSPSDALHAIITTHAALDDLELPLGDFDENLTAAAALFDDPTVTATLPAKNAEFCARVAIRLRHQLDAHTWQPRVLHGDPWLGGNLVNTTNGPRLIDFEAVCRGPLEWDLSSIAIDDIDGVDADLLGVCRALRSFTVAAWCWAQPGRAPDVDDAARWHLHRLLLDLRAVIDVSPTVAHFTEPRIKQSVDC